MRIPEIISKLRGKQQATPETTGDNSSPEEPGTLKWSAENKIAIPLAIPEIPWSQISIERSLAEPDTYTLTKTDGHFQEDKGVRIFFVDQEQYEEQAQGLGNPAEVYSWLKQKDLGGRSFALSTDPVTIRGKNLLLIIKRVDQQSKDRTTIPDIKRLQIRETGIKEIVIDRLIYWDTRNLLRNVDLLTQDGPLLLTEDPLEYLRNLDPSGSLRNGNNKEAKVDKKFSYPNAIGANTVLMYGLRSHAGNMGPVVPILSVELRKNSLGELEWHVKRPDDIYQQLKRANDSTRIQRVLGSLKLSDVEDLKNFTQGINAISTSTEQTTDQVIMFDGKNKMTAPFIGPTTFYTDAPKEMRVVMRIERTFSVRDHPILQITRGIEPLIPVTVVDNTGTISSEIYVTKHQAPEIEKAERLKAERRQKPEKAKKEVEIPIPENFPENALF